MAVVVYIVVILSVLFADRVDGQTDASDLACQERCVCVEYDVECTNQNLRQITWGFPANTTRISLKHNNISQLSLSSFENVSSSLQLLDLSHNLYRSPPAILRSLSELLFLNLSHNEIAFHSPHFRPFASNTKLRTLDLRHNRIFFVIQAFFSTLENLDTILLDGNLLQHLGFRDFVNNPNLSAITASNNNIGVLSFNPTTLIRTLDISGNSFEFTNASTHFQATPMLQNLRIGHSSLRYYDNTFTGLQRLLTLKLTDFSQTNLTSDFLRPCTYLLNLEVHGGSVVNVELRQLRHLSSLSLVGLPNMTSLSVTSCPSVKHDQVEIASLQSLTSVKLERLKWNMFNSTGLFHASNRITYLGLTRNLLRSLRVGSFDNLPFLEKLDLSYNRMTRVDRDSLMSLAKLDFVDLSGNIMTFIPERFLNSASVTTLSLSRNFIKGVSPDAFSNLPDLKSVDLSFNEIKAIAPFAVASVLYNLEGNTWECTCDLYKVLTSDSLNDTCRNKSSSNCYKCSTPLEYSGGTISALADKCKSDPGSSPYEPTTIQSGVIVGLCVGIGGLLLVILTILIVWKLCKRSKETPIPPTQTIYPLTQDSRMYTTWHYAKNPMFDSKLSQPHQPLKRDKGMDDVTTMRNDYEFVNA